MRLTAAQPGPWLRPATLLPLSEQQQKRPGRATGQPPNQKIPETRQKLIKVMTPTTDRGRRHQERVQETLGAPTLQALVTIVGKLLSLACVSTSADALDTP